MKDKSNVVYTVSFDPETRQPTEIEESVVAIAKADPATGAPEEYYIFTTRYRLDRFEQVDRFSIPREAAAILR